jgi:hypothetical protein
MMSVVLVMAFTVQFPLEALQEVTKSEQTSEVLAESESEDKFELLSAQDFTVELAETSKLTEEIAIVKAKASIDGNNEGMTVDFEQLNAIKDAKELKTFDLTFKREKLRRVVKVFVIDSNLKKDGKNGENIKVDLPNVDFWDPTEIYDITVTVNFGKDKGENKKVTITIPEGMKFDSIPVKYNAGLPGVFVPADSVLSGFLTNVSPPDLHDMYQTYSGELTYEFSANTEIVEIRGIKLAPDAGLYYGPKVFLAGITVEAQKNNQSIGSIVTQISTNTKTPIEFDGVKIDWQKNIEVIHQMTPMVETGAAGIKRIGMEGDIFLKTQEMLNLKGLMKAQM